jgi:hypothetical protein
MILNNPKLGPRFAPILAFGFVVLLVAASGALPSAVVHADSLLGPNLDVISSSGPTGTGSGSGAGCGGAPSTVVYNTSATDPGVTVTGTPCVTEGTGSGTFTKTISSSVAALNGYEIGDLSGSVTCATTGAFSLNLSFSGSLGSLTLNCPILSSTDFAALTASTIPTVPGEITFPSVLSGTETVMLTGTGTGTGGAVFGGFSYNLSLVPPTATPEPNSFLLLCTGLVGLAGMTRFRLLRR